MVNKTELRAECVRHGFSLDSLSRAMSIDPSTLYRKIRDNTFSSGEMQFIKDKLELSDTLFLTIFFA